MSDDKTYIAYPLPTPILRGSLSGCVKSKDIISGQFKSTIVSTSILMNYKCQDKPPIVNSQFNTTISNIIGANPYNMIKQQVYIKDDYSFIEGESNILNNDLYVYDYKNELIFFKKKGSYNTIGGFIYYTIDNTHSLYIIYNDKKYKLYPKIKGYLDLTITPKPMNIDDIKKTNMCIRVFNKSDGYDFIGEYDIINSKCHIDNLDVNGIYDILLADRNNYVESTTLSNRKPMQY